MISTTTSALKILLWTTVSVTFFLMTWGNLVSAAGAGLACPDWPLCHGTITPPARWDIVLEWGHRTIAAIASVLIIFSFFQVWRKSKTVPGLAPLQSIGKFILALLGVQILLGGITVLLELSALISTIHLTTALLIFAGLIYCALYVSHEDQTVIAPNSPESRKLVRLGRAALGGYIVQVILGGMVRHNHAGLSCPKFPLCSEGSFFPETFFFEAGLAFVHRWWGILLLGLFIQIAIATGKRAPALKKTAWFMLVLVLLQITLGIGAVQTGLSIPMRAVHAALGYFIWAVLVYYSVRSGGILLRWRAKEIALKQS